MTADRIDADYPSRWFDLVELRDSTFCHAVLFRRECQSTNDLAHESAATESGPLLVLADDQTGGRGRGSNQWWAREGALTTSLRLRPEQFGFEQARWPLVSLATAIAVADTLGGFASGCSVQLKWPNDVFLAGRKVCGILVEPARDGGEELVIGIGVNVLNSLTAAPEEIRDIATSIVDESPDPPGPGQFLLPLRQRCEQALSSLGSGQFNLCDRWQKQCLLSEKQISLESGERTVSGLCRGLDESGAILVETDGVVQPWFGGIVRLSE